MLNANSIKFAKELHNLFVPDLLLKEQLETTPLDDDILFELVFRHSPRKTYSVWTMISYDTLYDIKRVQHYCIIAFMRIMLYDIRKNKEPGRYKIGIELA